MSSAPKGRAIIEVLLDSNKINKQLKAVEDNFKKVGANIARIGTGFTAFGSGLVAALIVAANEAGDAAEVLSRFEAVFKGASREVKLFAAEVAKSIGRTEKDILDALSSYQAFFIGLGLGQNEAKELSKTLTTLALDFASFNNLADSDAQARFIAGLSGSSEVFDKFGINIKAAALDQKLLDQGLDVTTATATESQKVFARLAIIMESLGKQGAVGDALRTADSYNNVLKRLNASFIKLKTVIGSAVLKDIASFNAKISDSVSRLSDFIKNNPGIVKSLLQVGAALVVAGAAITAFGLSVIATGIAIGSLTTIVTAVTSALILAKTAAIAFFTSFAAPLTGVAILIGVIVNRIVDLKTLFKEVGTSITNDFGKAIETAKGSFDALKQAVLAGDLKLAFKILTTSIELFFRQSFKSILGYWDGLVGDFLLGINFITTAWQKFILKVDGLFIGLEITGSKTVDTIISTFSEAASTLNIIFIQITTEIRTLWLGIKALFKAGLRIGDGDISGARQVFEDLEKAKTDIRKEADKAIEAELKLDFKGDSIKTENLKQLLVGNDALYQDVLKKSAEQEIKIISDLNEKTDARDLQINKTIDDLKFFSLVARQQANKQKEFIDEQANAQNDQKNAANAIKSIIPKFGQLVEAGSSQSLKLFGSNNNPLVKEQQKSNKILNQIAVNTNAIEVR
jgi:hypothetical protein